MTGDGLHACVALMRELSLVPRWQRLETLSVGGVVNQRLCRSSFALSESLVLRMGEEGDQSVVYSGAGCKVLGLCVGSVFFIGGHFPGLVVKFGTLIMDYRPPALAPFVTE